MNDILNDIVSNEKTKELEKMACKEIPNKQLSKEDMNRIAQMVEDEDANIKAMNDKIKKNDF